MELTTTYHGSKGAVLIATMNGKHAATAAAKLRREAPERTAEIAALQAHADNLAAEAEAAANEAEANPRAVLGGNHPPEDAPATPPTGRPAIEAHVDDLLTEAGNWADGVEIATQAQADDVARLRGELQKAAKLVDECATEEKRPHNEAITAIGTWQNGFTAKGLRKTPDGKLTKALMATGNLLTNWLAAQEREKRQREAEAAAAAQKAAAEALAAREDAKASTDLGAIDNADEKLANAEALIKQAKGVSREKVAAGGGQGMRVQSLRSYWTHHTTDYKALLRHVMDTNPAALRAMLDDYARAEVARGIRSLPGVEIAEDRKVA